MTDPNDQSRAALTPAAAGVLTRALGAPVRLGAAEPLSPGADVFRFPLLAGPPDAHAQVVVKVARPSEDAVYDPADPSWPALAWLLFNEWSGLQIVQQRAGDQPLAPRIFGGDRSAGVVVLEDLGPARTVYDTLLQDDPLVAAEEIVGMAHVLGRLHAVTMGHEAVFDHLRDALGPRLPSAPFGAAHAYDWLAGGFHQAAAQLDIDLPPGVDGELQELRAALRAPGPFRAYCHGDVSPVNFLRVGDQMRLYDLEMSGFRYALAEGVAFRMHVPGGWSAARLPEGLALRAEAAYRDALAAGCPAATDDATFNRGVVTACAFWAVDHCTFWLDTLLDHDVVMHRATMRQAILARFDTMAQTTAEVGAFEALGAGIGRMAARLRALWRPDLLPMPYYPAFADTPMPPAEPVRYG